MSLSIHRSLLAVTVVAAMAVSAAPAVQAATPAKTGSPTHVLGGDVLPGLRTLKSQPTSPDTPMQVGLTLADPHAADIDRVYAELYSPDSPRFHQFLDAEEVARTLGAPADAAAGATRWATRAGMKVAFSAPTNEYVLLQGTARQVERTFGVKLRTYTDGPTTFVANTKAPTVPAAVEGALGLNTKLRSKLATPSQGTCVGACVGQTTPQDLWSIYEQPTNLADPKADFGQGQEMAVLGEGAVAGVITDLRAFEHEHALPQTPITIRSVGDNFKDDSGEVEWALDTQASTGMAPKVTGETLYFAKDLTDSSILADFIAWSGDRHGPMQANASFGECEQDPTSTPGNNDAVGSPLAGAAGVAFVKASERALQEAAIQGKTLFSSTGDTGSSCPVVAVNGNGVANQALPETSYPASSRYVVAVGGTVLYGSANTAPRPGSNASRTEEYAWTYSGGGNTLYIPQPGYQKGISLLDNQRCVSKPNGTPYASPTPCRGIPDVAAQSGDIATNGYAITAGGMPDRSGGGTSLSSPLWMGMWVRIQAAARPTHNGRPTLGFANETLYRVAKNSSAFFDVGGTDKSNPAGNGYYTALPRSPLDPTGWDYVSGLGVPRVSTLARLATGNTALVPTRNASIPPVRDCGQPGLAPCRPVGPASCVPGGPRWTNPTHTATDIFGNDDPQLSLASGNVTLSPDGSTVQVRVTLEDLSKTIPPGATGTAWYSTWDYAGQTYFAAAELGPDGSLAYSDGTSSGNRYTSAHVDSGSFSAGHLGTVTVEVPGANVGRPGRGATLSNLAAVTYTNEGVPSLGGSGGSGLLARVDTGGPGCPAVL